jgi:peptidoglycan hydrolase-like protein with peptidoglycan-binding domain
MVSEEPRPTSGPPPEPSSGRRLRVLFGATGVLVVVLAGFAVAAFAMSGASLGSDPDALAKVDAQAFGGTIEQVHASGPDGKPIPIAVHDGRLIPKRQLTPGETVSVEVVVKRPSWVGWLVGNEQDEHLTLHAPVARVRTRWLTVKPSAPPRVSFDQPVRSVAYGTPGHLHHRVFAHPRRSVSLGSRQSAGTVVVVAAPRSWERLSKPQSVTWFPAGDSPSVAASPAPGSDVSPATPLRLTFSKPVSQVLGSRMPTLSPDASGSWHRVDGHTLLFRPSGYGAGLSTTVEAELPKQVDVIGSDGSLRSGDSIEWNIPPGSTLRLQQLLAEAGYLPVDWKPSGARVAHTPSAELRAAVEPPKGHFHWRYSNVPSGLHEAWSAGEENVATEGAVMAFESQHEMEIDGSAGSEVWDALLRAAIAGKRNPESGYSYVSVSETLPEKVTLWHDGHTIFTAAANTGIPGAETALGTYPVFEHLEETTMSGENPDGSHYEDPGIMWVSYFNGGDALHSFDRPSYGSPQSLGCVEMALEDAAKVWPYTPIGTLVTVEE